MTDDEYVSIPQRARGGPRLLAVAGVILVAIVVVVAAAGLWASRQIDPAGEPGAVDRRDRDPAGIVHGDHLRPPRR